MTAIPQSSPCARRSPESGQSYVETVVMLPVLLAIFLGLYYFHDLTHMRIRAVEAARYMTWESVWSVREGNPGRAYKTNAQLAQELQDVGLGWGLMQVGNLKRSLSQYRSDVSGLGTTLFFPQFLANFFPGGGGGTAAFTQIPGAISGVLGPILDLSGDVAVPVHDTFAGMSNWGDEAGQAVYTARVAYALGSAGFFQSLGTIQVREFSSILSHPFNVVRTDDNTEWVRMFGEPTDLCRDEAHVFGIWLFPSGDFGAALGNASGMGSLLGTIGEVIDVLKCVGGGAGSLFANIDSALSTNVGFQLPYGTLKEYPELNIE